MGESINSSGIPDLIRDPGAIIKKENIAHWMLKQVRDAALLFIFCVCLPLGLLQAQETSSYPYSPEGCAFEAIFPFEPGFTRRCPSDTNQPCFKIAQYTNRSDSGQTINVEMSCTPITQELYHTYNQDNLEILILQMAQNSNLSAPPPVSYQEENGV